MRVKALRKPQVLHPPSPPGKVSAKLTDIITMKKHYNKQLTENSKQLRKNMTKEERHLWYDFLKGLPATINRQKVIGNYIVDFYCDAIKTAIELDGSEHFNDHGIEYDKKRDEYLNSLGIRVLRYSNYDVNTRFKSVCEDILKETGINLQAKDIASKLTSSSTASGPPSPEGSEAARAVLNDSPVGCQIRERDRAAARRGTMR